MFHTGNQTIQNPVPKLSLAWLSLSVALLIVTAGTVIWGLRRGFDLTDEGYYLLSHAYYKEYPSSSGFALLGGWLFEHFHLDVVSLRGLRFLLLIAAHVVFSANALRWVLSSFRFLPEARRLVRWSFFFLVGSVAASYQWAPPSLSYNDWATIFALLAAACVLRLLAGDSPSNKAPLGFALLGLVIGLLLGGLAFVKWTAGAAAIPLLALAVIAGRGGERRVRGPVFSGMVVGGLLALALIHATMIDLRTFSQQFVESTALIAHQSHAPPVLLLRYIRQFLAAMALPWVHFWWALPLLAVLSGSLLRFPQHRRALSLMACLLFGMTLRHCFIRGYLDGAGATYRSVTIQLGLVLMAGAALLGGWILESPRIGPIWTIRCFGYDWTLARPVAPRWEAVRTWLSHRRKPIAGLTVLFGLPWVVAFGTGNPLLLPGAQVIVAWKVLVLIPIAALWASPPVRTVGFGIGLLSLIATQAQFLDGYILHPYRLPTPLYAQSVPVPNLPRGHALLFDAETAASLKTLASRVASRHPGENPRIMAFFDCPGIVYLLGGRSPAIPWYFSPRRAPGYTPAMLRQWAKIGKRPSNSLRPLILLDQELDQSMLGVLRDIGADFPSAYQEIGVSSFPYGDRVFHLWAPRDLNSDP